MTVDNQNDQLCSSLFTRRTRAAADIDIEMYIVSSFQVAVCR